MDDTIHTADDMEKIFFSSPFLTLFHIAIVSCADAPLVLCVANHTANQTTICSWDSIVLINI